MDRPNLYRSQDIFLCRLDDHRRFGYRVSAHHVLSRRKCYPGGCVHFTLRCRLMDSGGRCKRTFKHPGRLCGNCPHLEEQKRCLHVEIQCDRAQWETFSRDYEEFEDWARDIARRQIEFEGFVARVLPWIAVEPETGRLQRKGVLVGIEDCYLGYDRLKDLIWLRLTWDKAARMVPEPGGRLAGIGRVFWVGSRAHLETRRLDVDVRGAKDMTELRVLASGAQTLDRERGICYTCLNFQLAENGGDYGLSRGRRRTPICLAGNSQSASCSEYSPRRTHLEEERCFTEIVPKGTNRA